MTLVDEPLLLDSPPARPCTHRRAKHVHGTRACWASDRCRCPQCCAAQSAYQADRYQQISYGRWVPYADAQPAREHVEALMREGLSLNAVVRRSGLSSETVRALLHGRNGRPVKRINKSTARKLLAVTAGRYRATTPALLTLEATT